MRKLNEEFFNHHTDEWSDYFTDYFENQRVMRIMLGSEYKKINKAICEIKNKYPNVVTLLEDGENVKLNDEEEMYEEFIRVCKDKVPKVEHGVFGADMKVELLNDGPFTIVLDSKEL